MLVQWKPVNVITLGKREEENWNENNISDHIEGLSRTVFRTNCIRSILNAKILFSAAAKSKKQKAKKAKKQVQSAGNEKKNRSHSGATTFCVFFCFFFVFNRNNERKKHTNERMNEWECLQHLNVFFFYLKQFCFFASKDN